MVKGERYLMDMKVRHYGYNVEHFLAIARKTSERSWSSLRGESQTFDIQYDYHGEELTLNLGNVVGGHYKLQLVYKPFGGDVVTGTTRAIRWDESPEWPLWYIHRGSLSRTSWNGAFSPGLQHHRFVVANTSPSHPEIYLFVCYGYTFI